MEFNIDYNIIMYIIIAIIIVYILFSILGTAKTVEGMTDKKNDTKSYTDLVAEGAYKQMKTVIQKNDDIMLLDKYKSDYEDVLIDMEELLNQIILMEVILTSSAIGSKNIMFGMEKVNTETLDKLNNLYKLRDNLSSTMDYIDGKKSSGTKSSGFF